MNEARVARNRRHFLACLSAMGLGSTLLPEALTIAAQDADIVTIDILEAAQKIAAVSFTRAEQQAILTRLNAASGYMAGFAALRAANLRDDEPPSIVFNPVPPGKVLPSGARGLTRRAPDVSRPSTDEALAFLPVTHLARLVETRQVKPSELTELSLSRLAKYDPISPLRRLSHAGDGAGAGPRSRQRNRRRQVSRTIARHSVRPQGSVRRARDQNNVGSLAVERSGHRRRRHGLYEAQSRGRDHGREAVDRSARGGSTMVRRIDSQPLERQRRCGWFVGRFRRGHGRWTRRVRHRLGHRRIDHWAGRTKRCCRFTAHVRTRQPPRWNDAGLDARHCRSAVSIGRGLRPRVRRDLRPRRQGQQRSRRALSMGCHGRRPETARRLPPVRIRKPARGNRQTTRDAPEQRRSPEDHPRHGRRGGAIRSARRRDTGHRLHPVGGNGGGVRRTNAQRHAPRCRGRSRAEHPPRRHPCRPFHSRQSSTSRRTGIACA